MKGRRTSSPPAKTLTPEQAREEYFPDMGRGAFYAALGRKEIPCVRVGRRYLIPRDAIEPFLSKLRDTRKSWRPSLGGTSMTAESLARQLEARRVASQFVAPIRKTEPMPS